MKKRNMTRRGFMCPECDCVQVAYKRSCRRTKTGHIKTMYCWKCRTIQNLVQLSRYDY